MGRRISVKKTNLFQLFLHQQYSKAVIQHTPTVNVIIKYYKQHLL